MFILKILFLTSKCDATYKSSFKNIMKYQNRLSNFYVININMFEPVTVTKENLKYPRSKRNHVNFHIFKNKTLT